MEKAVFFSLRLLSFMVIFFLFFMLGYIVKNGISAISWEFISAMPREEMTRGGIFPAILGTFYLMSGASIVSIPVGIITAIYLTEYARSPRLVKMIRLGVSNLAGVPSVVFGLFASASSFIFLISAPPYWRAPSLWSAESAGDNKVNRGGADGGSAILPRGLPLAGSHALADHIQDSCSQCPAGHSDGVMLSLGRAAGETAPIMYTPPPFPVPICLIRFSAM
jgi:phosphate transport system permease protein